MGASGNPGLLGYYPPFLNHLYSLLPAGHALISMSHNGHTPDLIAPDQPLDLPAQLDSKIEITEALRSSLDVWAAETIAAKPKLALMGHSVGAWLLCEVMKRVKSGVVDTGYMLFPTLGWLAHSWNGRTLWVRLHLHRRVASWDTVLMRTSAYLFSASKIATTHPRPTLSPNPSLHDIPNNDSIPTPLPKDHTPCITPQCIGDGGNARPGRGLVQSAGSE